MRRNCGKNKDTIPEKGLNPSFGAGVPQIGDLRQAGPSGSVEVEHDVRLTVGGFLDGASGGTDRAGQLPAQDAEPR